MAAPKRKGQPYFEVGRVKFPLISSDQFKKADVRLIEAITGCDWKKWCKLLAAHGLEHEHTIQGFFAVAVQRARKATHDEVQEFIDDLPLIDGVKLVIPDAPKEGDAVPPVEDETADT